MTVKVLEGHTLPEQRANTLIITSGTGESHVISCGNTLLHWLYLYNVRTTAETRENICEWTTTIHQTTVQAVQTVAVSNIMYTIYGNMYMHTCACTHVYTHTCAHACTFHSKCDSLGYGGREILNLCLT